jgi:hypothetical protein
MRRSFRTRGCFSGWIPRVCTLGWYAMPLQGMDRERGRRSGVGDAIGAPYRKRPRGSVSETRWASVSETPWALRADGLIR